MKKTGKGQIFWVCLIVIAALVGIVVFISGNLTTQVSNSYSTHGSRVQSDVSNVGK